MFAKQTISKKRGIKRKEVEKRLLKKL